MTESRSYTTEEIAGLLKISKLTVYGLIKTGKLPAYRVGRQMRVDADDLEAYKAASKGRLDSTGSARAGQIRQEEPAGRSAETERDDAGRSFDTADSSGAAGQNGAVGQSDLRKSSGEAEQRSLAGRSGQATYNRVTKQGGSGAVRSVIITGQDIGLDLLAKHLEKTSAQYRPLRLHVGSLNGLIALYRGEADIVSTHLLDGDSGEYNVPYIRRVLVGFPLIVIRMLSRTAGLYVQPGNPKGIHGWQDLDRSGIKIANREKGAGARVLLEEQLRLRGLAASALEGYEDEETTHLGVAGKVASGMADAGVGVEKAAHIVGVDFIPLIQEKYDLVVLKTPANRELIELVQGALGDKPFLDELRAVRGYDLTEAGRIVWESR
ncbi:substrate-binding domain-containing protein [Paenibacillus thalictri]|uniref:Helix-turn-helix domain-containing protein n=1 Tax=Paenibacillus thalictri TaxID=2527873 RepID=A0A4Q9E033_9BACL|nr:helix-turn-helix transcriptional regulator [Paenibacillus thalictri]TBL81780.1 helix-turn-helix domain-containing protein [Paenibacillus thalictri]